MTRKWCQLVDGKGKDLTEVFPVSVMIEVVYAFLREVKTQFGDSYLAGIASSDLAVFANREAYNRRQKLPKASSSLAALGKDEDSPIIVEVPARRRVGMEEQPHKKARSWTAIEDEIMETIGHNLNIDAWHVGGIDLNIHKVEKDFPEWFYV